MSQYAFGSLPFHVSTFAYFLHLLRLLLHDLFHLQLQLIHLHTYLLFLVILHHNRYSLILVTGPPPPPPPPRLLPPYPPTHSFSGYCAASHLLLHLHIKPQIYTHSWSLLHLHPLLHVYFLWPANPPPPPPPTQPPDPTNAFFHTTIPPFPPPLMPAHSTTSHTDTCFHTTIRSSTSKCLPTHTAIHHSCTGSGAVL